MARSAVRGCWIGAACLASAVAAQAPREAASDPRALVEAAIEAHGGERALTTWADMRLAGRATYYLGASERKGDAKVFVRGGTMLRRESITELGGGRRESISASNGKSAWQRRGARVYDQPADDHTTWLRHQPDILLRAAARPEALRYGGRVELEGDSVDLVDFEESGETTRIVLDVATRQVRALEYKAMSNRGEGKKEEQFIKKSYSEYEPVDGVPFPRHWEEYSDGVRTLALVVTEVVLGQAPDASLFVKPEADEEAREWSDQIAN